MASIINASTSAGVVTTADTSGTLQLQSAGVTQMTVDSTGAYGQIKTGTAVASTSGTSITFTGIPSWAKRITVMFSAVSVSGTANVIVQVGSGSVSTTSYSSQSSRTAGAGSTASSTATNGHLILGGQAVDTLSGHMILTSITGNTWISSHAIGNVGSTTNMAGGGLSPNLAGSLDRIVITTSNGTDTFDAGSVNIMWEG